MGEPMKKTSCQIACWAMGAGAGFVAFVMLMALGDWSFIQAVFGAAVVFIVLGGLLSWILCKPLPALGEIKAGMDELDATPAPKAESVSAPVAAAPAPVAAQPASAAPVAEVKSAEVKSGTLLEGEKELASRKGNWSYQAEAAPAPAATVTSKPKAKTEATAAPVAAAEGAKPATLTAARGGQADNLKEIKGVGPKLEAMLHGMGFYHFDQIAAWTAAEVAWVDENLTGFKGRATRDDWVGQAKILASGGETAFSKRVEDGDVY
ncbi:MAG: endonuclease [Paracoccaceae bacterium]|uniref:endonuclease n=1 Tax=unclassified Seohaeicola TaxID=2641111 RepID=UPI00237AD0E6|nr:MULTISPECIES: endonuclease [unclassified Seohaeicola]MDD9708464.1 endonuclease [Seohaeicola sp. 4SK31]MDD9736563.1 endonuclease [Seohaeicola sp. SP36]